MTNSVQSICLLLTLAVFSVGCSETGPTVKPAAKGDPKYLLTNEPTGATGVADTLKAATDQQEVTVVGRIGGAEDPWVKGVAAFTIVDTKLKPCNEIPGDNCPVPWDYCCDSNELPTHSVTVKFVDEQGAPIGVDARELLGVDHLQTVVVTGRMQKTNDKTVVLANKMYVRPK